MTPGLCPLCGHKTYPTMTTVRRGPVPDKGRSVSQDRAERQESLGL